MNDPSSSRPAAYIQDVASIDSSTDISGTIDPNDTSYFIQYQPELAEKLSKHQSKHSVSGRCLSIVLSRMIFWSRYSKYKHDGKLFYYKSQGELSEETGFAVKTINRALKVLVDLGLLIRHKLMKNRYYQCYFYHIPLSPFTKQIKTGRTKTSTARRNSSTSRSNGAAGTAQKVHSRASGGSGEYFPAAAAQVHSSSTIASAGAADPSCRPDLRAHNPKVSAPRTINTSKGFGSSGRNCPIHNKEKTSNKKNTLKDILLKCISYGEKDIYEERFLFGT